METCVDFCCVEKAGVEISTDACFSSESGAASLAGVSKSDDRLLLVPDELYKADRLTCFSLGFGELLLWAVTCEVVALEFSSAVVAGSFCWSPDDLASSLTSDF